MFIHAFNSTTPHSIIKSSAEFNLPALPGNRTNLRDCFKNPPSKLLSRSFCVKQYACNRDTYVYRSCGIVLRNVGQGASTASKWWGEMVSVLNADWSAAVKLVIDSSVVNLCVMFTPAARSDFW